MIAALQRVDRAAVRVSGETIAEIGRGLLVLVGIGSDDAQPDIDWMVRKIPELRLFADLEGKMNLSVREAGGELLLVSQFTLLADCRRGRRPSYSRAMPPGEAALFFDQVLEAFAGCGVPCQSGRFGATMDVELVNAGPVTILLDSRIEERVSRRGRAKEEAGETSPADAAETLE